MPNDGMVSMLDRWEQQGNPFAVTPRKKKATENDGGPGSGNFGHEGRPGKVGGAAGSETTQTSKTSSHGSSKNFQSLIPSDSYTNTTDYQNASKTFKSALKKRDEIDDKRNAVKKELESESHPKPRSEWTEDDEIYDMLGDRPMVYTDKGKELKAQSDKLFKEWSAADHELTEAGDRLRDIKKKAHDEQIKSVSFDKPVKASSDDYEGFTTKTTGTGYDEYLNGKQNGGYVAEMSPAEYLQRCAYQVFENATIESTLAAINEKNVDEYAKKMESGEKFDMPYLNLEKSEQEGRHRAAAAMKAGIEKIPVLVVGYKQNADSTDTHGSVGVLVIKDGRILCGIRSGNTAPGCICGPGGHIENGETPEQAAIRETQEEFGITPKDLVPIGNGPAESDTGYSPNLFLCTDYNGEPNCTSDEMSWAQFVDLDRFANNPPSMFQPFADSIICLLDAMSGSEHEDGGPGSGHFGHESEKGKRGGSIKSHVRLEGCSDSTKTLIDEALENPYGYGGIDTEARKQSIRSALEKDGVKVTVDEDGLSMAFSPKFSYDDCIDANIAMNGYNMLGRKDYIRQCNDAGSEPLLHETPEALQYVDKPDDGSLSIYDRFNSYNALNDDDIVKYGAFDHDQNPNGNEALTKASISAIENLTPEQHEALVDYTQQYGAATYTEINHYLTSPDEEKTGYSDVVAKNAAAITKALDKEIGADCLVSRGQSDLIGIAPDKKLENYVKQISKCNFKNASKLKQALEGKVIQNDAVMSTSAGNSAGDYSACSVQLLLKTPAKAKAVDLSAISAYGTHSEVEKALAAAIGQSLSYEHEIAFKPGTQYKIDSVDIGFRSASRDRKKPSAYVYITGTVLTDDERTDGVFFACELNSKANTPDLGDNFPANVNKRLTEENNSGTILSQNKNTDGGPGSGNHNHEGRPGKVGGSSGKLSEHEKKVLTQRLVGKKTHDGVEIKKISSHAFDRLGGRSIPAKVCEKLLSEGIVTPGHTERTKCYNVPHARMVLDVKSGTIVTVMWRRENK
jgi:8-oxo-dGTP pyrophosphatase MutT (NUDIX family)